MWLYHRVTSPKDAEGIANSVDPDQTAPLGADLGLHCLPRPVCPKKLRIITVVSFCFVVLTFKHVCLLFLSVSRVGCDLCEFVYV